MADDNPCHAKQDVTKGRQKEQRQHVGLGGADSPAEMAPEESIYGCL